MPCPHRLPHCPAGLPPQPRRPVAGDPVFPPQRRGPVVGDPVFSPQRRRPVAGDPVFSPQRRGPVAGDPGFAFKTISPKNHEEKCPAAYQSRLNARMQYAPPRSSSAEAPPTQLPPFIL